MKKQYFIIPLVAVAIFYSSLLRSTEAISTENTAGTSAYTKMFIEQTTLGNKFIIESSELALEKSNDTEIKEFAEKIIDDHKQVFGKLKFAATESNTTDLMPESLDQPHQNIIDQLKNTEPDAFRQSYLEAQNNAHTEAVNLLREYAENGDNIFFKEFSQDAASSLYPHKDHIDTLLKESAD